MAMRLVGLALLFGTSAALAFDSTKVGQWGSLYLDDLSPVLAKSAQLKREVTAALARKNKKPEDILCFGMRFPGPWKNLGGMASRPTPATSTANIFASTPPFVSSAAVAGRSRQSTIRR